MVGPTYYDESNRIYDAGIAEGISQGKEEVILSALSVGSDPKDISRINGISLDLYFKTLSLEYNTQLYARKSLIVFDEIQKFPKAREAINI